MNKTARTGCEAADEEPQDCSNSGTDPAPAGPHSQTGPSIVVRVAAELNDRSGNVCQQDSQQHNPAPVSQYQLSHVSLDGLC